jgi:cytochrome b subunit of formate dehydrogenase
VALNFIAVVLLVGTSWLIVYYLAWIPLVNEGIPKLPELLAKANLASTAWWRDALAVAFDILIIFVAIIGTWWTLGHFAAQLREIRRWRQIAKEAREWVVRFTIWQRIQHIWLVITFIVCAFTGFAMHFANNPYWKDFMTSRDTYAVVHVVSGWAMGVLVLLHFTYYGVKALLAKMRGAKLMDEYPILRIYTLTFLKNLARRLAWTLTPRVAKPASHKYNEEQMFGYWGVYWGIAILGVPGLIMSIWGPSVLNGVLWVMHYKEAILAVVYLMLVHIAYAHFSPPTFPINTVFIHGKMPLEYVKEEHPLWYEQLARKQEVEKAQPKT